MDASAAFALGKLHRSCAVQGVALTLSGLAPAMRTDLMRALGPDGAAPELAERFDDMLRAIEDRLLAEGRVAAQAPGFVEDLARLAPQFDRRAWFRETTVPAGDEVYAEDAPADGMVLLLDGVLRAEAAGLDGRPMRVATILPGALVSEIGLYAGIPRSARVLAETPARLMCVDAAALDRMAESDPALAAAFHRLVAARLARRLIRANAVLRDVEAM